MKNLNNKKPLNWGFLNDNIMTQQIIEKIFKGEELDAQEKIFVSKKLKEKEGEKVGNYISLEGMPPIDCKAREFTASLGLTRKHFDEFNEINEKNQKILFPGELGNMASAVAVYEQSIPEYPMGLRIALCELMRLKANPLSRMFGL